MFFNCLLFEQTAHIFLRLAYVFCQEFRAFYRDHAKIPFLGDLGDGEGFAAAWDAVLSMRKVIFLNFSNLSEFFKYSEFFMFFYFPEFF